MGSMSSILGLLGGQGVTPGSQAAGGAISNLGQSIASIGNASNGVIPQTTNPVPSTPGAPIQTGVNPALSHALQANNSSSNAQGTVATPGGAGATIAPVASPSTAGVPTTSTTAGTVPTTSNAPVGGGTLLNPGGAGLVNGGDFNSVYGVDTGTAVTNLLNSESPGSADSTAQSIINANASNVAEGSANLNTGLAASGISPSSSVSALENSNYQSQNALNDQSELAQVNLTEQGQQQQLLESLLPSQQQRQTDSSGWSIFGDVLSGIGDVATLGLGNL
jgi:hypothetical protein